MERRSVIVDVGERPGVYAGYKRQQTYRRFVTLPGLEKDQCKVQPCIGPVGRMLIFVLLFRGLDLRTSKVELAVYDKYIYGGRVLPEVRKGGQRVLHDVS